MFSCVGIAKLLWKAILYPISNVLLGPHFRILWNVGCFQSRIFCQSDRCKRAYHCFNLHVPGYFSDFLFCELSVHCLGPFFYRVVFSLYNYLHVLQSSDEFLMHLCCYLKWYFNVYLFLYFHCFLYFMPPFWVQFPFTWRPFFSNFLKKDLKMRTFFPEDGIIQSILFNDNIAN